MRRALATRKARGSALVEFAVLLPVLVAIVCGTIDWGYYFFVREVIVNASREGARVGTLQFDAGEDSRAEAEAAARAYLADASLDPLKITELRTDVSRDGGTCPTNASCVRITYDIGGSVTGFTGSFVPSSIAAYAQMRIRL
jgi:Flp pilus assembly protein TadG